MKRLVSWSACLLCLTMLLPALHSSVMADTTILPSPPPNTAPDLIVTALAAGPLPPLSAVELFSQADTPLRLDDWHLDLTAIDNAACATGRDVVVNLPAGWMLPKHYLTLVQDGTIPGGSAFTLDPDTLADCISPQLASLRLVRGNTEGQVIAIPGTGSLPTDKVVQHKQRNNALSTTRTLSGSFIDDYSKQVTLADAVFYSDPLYAPPVSTRGLQILELLPNARPCSPLDTDLTCTDYIKLYNPTEDDINLADFRLRVGYKGQGTSVTNTFTWGAQLDPLTDGLVLPKHQYLTLATRNDGAPLTLTDSGAYVWLEDAYGTTTYQPVIQYPDASSTAKVGLAWAYNGIAWQWTSAPQPGGPNIFRTVLPAAITVPNTLAPCDPGQYRNPDTNRCRTIGTATSLVPCGAGQERNPETNRCRSVITASDSTLTPCQPGWDRNPDTNRCRKSAAVEGAAITKVQDVAAPIVNQPKWILVFLAGLAAAAYAVYEWRQDIALALGAAKAKITRFLPGRHKP